VAPPKSEFDVQMQYLEAEIRRLEAEFNMFFAGRLPRPPAETRAKVAALVKRHDQSFIRNTGDRFRFETLQTRFQKFIDLVDRQMTNRELGRPMFGVKRSEPAASPPTPASPPPAAAPSPPAPAARAAEPAPAAGEPGERVVRFGKGGEGDRVKELFESLAEARKKVGEAPLPIDRVQALVKAQMDKFGGGADFKIAMKDGKVSLTVKPVNDGE
jgi:hypothetical protein